MNIHRAVHDDWSDISADDRNIWQRTAAATSGVITPGNAISMLGCLIVISGALLLTSNAYITGFILLVLGRSADLFDGFVADKTGTKSRLGEAIDASVDKFVTAAAFIMFSLAGLLPAFFAAAIALHAAFGLCLFLVARGRTIRIHPSTAGKLTTAVEWTAIGITALSRAANSREYGHVGNLLAFIFIMLAIYASAGYIFSYQKLMLRHV